MKKTKNSTGSSNIAKSMWKNYLRTPQITASGRRKASI